MEVTAHALGSYGRNLDQRTCVYQRSAIDEISHDGTGTCEREPAWFYLRSSYDRSALSVSCSSFYFKTDLGTLILSRPSFSTKTASFEMISSHDPQTHRVPEVQLKKIGW